MFKSILLSMCLFIFMFKVASAAEEGGVDLSDFVQSLETVSVKGAPVPPVSNPGENPQPVPMPSAQVLSAGKMKNPNLKATDNSWATKNPKLGKPIVSSIVSILSASGGMLTVWSLSPGTWVWGYTALDTLGLSNLMEWQLYTYRDGFVVIQNFSTKTCLTALDNIFSEGAAHVQCDPDMVQQRWIFNRFANGSIQIKNVGYGTCLQTPLQRSTTYYTIYLTSCATGQNLDQQWALMSGFRRPGNPIVQGK
ncbi:MULTISPECIES: RICIN domain-containing protein [unclassified Helicobacter]|uniref:RICIN domain-containing protein n=1 Tax=unclassified Helicobacter TaxID=2593540 RepID=UPI000CF03297|nr:MULTISPECIES: RICIN domain-containing protein [unclassified Helicobacter]